MYFTRWVEIFKLKHIHDQEQEQQAGAGIICHISLDISHLSFRKTSDSKPERTERNTLAG